jgi:hypothetical protein
MRPREPTATVEPTATTNNTGPNQGASLKNAPREHTATTDPTATANNTCPNQGAILQKCAPRAHSDRPAHSDSQEHRPQPGGYGKQYNP